MEWLYIVFYVILYSLHSCIHLRSAISYHNTNTSNDDASNFLCLLRDGYVATMTFYSCTIAESLLLTCPRTFLQHILTTYCTYGVKHQIGQTDIICMVTKEQNINWGRLCNQLPYICVNNVITPGEYSTHVIQVYPAWFSHSDIFHSTSYPLLLVFQRKIVLRSFPDTPCHNWQWVYM